MKYRTIEYIHKLIENDVRERRKEVDKMTEDFKKCVLNDIGVSMEMSLRNSRIYQEWENAKKVLEDFEKENWGTGL